MRLVGGATVPIRALATTAYVLAGYLSGCGMGARCARSTPAADLVFQRRKTNGRANTLHTR